ncbi:MAG: histone deacetylase [Verrucomicrobiota bacterium]|nr:histone deacetylase [Verrucomicrobiota bacterium]
MLIFYEPRCVEYSRAGHPERPERVAATVPFLRQRHPDWEWRDPPSATREMLLRAHSTSHVDAIENGLQDFDADSPAYPDIFAHASRASGAAVEVARAAMRGEKSFSLMRPPGHHATRDQAMGFCYFNHIAVAAFDALTSGAKRVAIWDFDAHHGNGTEALVANHAQISFASVHQSPGYPGTGLRSFGNIHNFPVRPLTLRAQHMAEIERALHSLGEFEPDLLIVSAGFDAYARDPITEMTLQSEDFATCGQWLRQSGIPAGAVLEGGYSDELPELIDAFLSAWSG